MVCRVILCSRLVSLLLVRVFVFVAYETTGFPFCGQFARTPTRLFSELKHACNYQLHSSPLRASFVQIVGLGLNRVASFAHEVGLLCRGSKYMCTL